MNILKPLKKLFLPDQSVREVITPPPPAAISRRTFFSFFGAGVAVAAAPGLFLGPSARFAATGGNHIGSAPLWTRIGKIVKTHILGNISYADVELDKPMQFSGASGSCLVFSGVPIMEHSGVGDVIYAGPGNQWTTKPPNEKIWAMGEKMRGLKPGEVDIPMTDPTRPVSAWECHGDHTDLDPFGSVPEKAAIDRLFDQSEVRS
jgi:hypothetical protein